MIRIDLMTFWLNKRDLLVTQFAWNRKDFAIALLYSLIIQLTKNIFLNFVVNTF